MAMAIHTCENAISFTGRRSESSPTETAHQGWIKRLTQRLRARTPADRHRRRVPGIDGTTHHDPRARQERHHGGGARAC